MTAPEAKHSVVHHLSRKVLYMSWRVYTMTSQWPMISDLKSVRGLELLNLICNRKTCTSGKIRYNKTSKIWGKIKEH